MGYLTEIFRYSKKPFRNTTEKALAPVSHENPGRIFGMPERQPPAESEAYIPDRDNKKINRSWEENIGKNGTAPHGEMSQEPDSRQMVGPSPLENKRKMELPEAQMDVSSSPDSGKQKQAGLKNRHDVAFHSRVNRVSDFYDVVSIGREVFSSNDSSVVIPALKHSEKSESGKSVDVTRRRRQAGKEARAGATTPPGQTAGDMTVSGSEENTSVITLTDSIKPDLKTASNKIKNDHPLNSQKQAETDNTEKMNKENTDFSDVPTPLEAVSNVKDFINSPEPEKEYFNKVHEPVPISSESSQNISLIKPDQHDSYDSGKPGVHIGFMEIIVTTPDSRQPARTSDSNESDSFSSRHYLRTF